MAQAGDTVILLPGRYAGTLRPINSGTAKAPITFRAEPRLAATLTGPQAGRTLVLEGLQHIRIEGLHIDPDREGVGWLTMRSCAYVVVEDCRMENSTLGLAAHIDTCEQVKIRNSVFQRQTGGINMLRVSGVTRFLFEGNAVSRAGHSPLQFYPPNTNRYLVVRGNVFHAAWGRNFEFFHDRDVLFEQNIITHALNGGWSASSNAKLGLTRGIFRFNRIFRNFGGAINLYPWEDDGALATIRLYNNVFDDNAHYGVAVSSRSDKTRDLLFVNNIFSRNDTHGMQCQVRLAGGRPEQVKLVRNAFAASQPGLPVVRDYGRAFSVAAVEGEEVAAEHGARYSGNLDLTPGFVDPSQYNHALAPDSPLRNAGRFLTTARGSGQGVLLPVDDPAFFYDGFGIDGELGDLITVGMTGQEARVVEVDHARRSLRLDRELSWQDGDPVSLPWTGGAPDIGVYEHGTKGRVSVQVLVEPFEARPGEDVNLRAVVHGAAQVQTVRWWLGDGSTAEGPEIIHRYDDEYDYPIRVQVLDTQGHTHYGSGYLWVTEPVDPSAPLIHSSWCPDDDRSWWLWKSYRPVPAAYLDVVQHGSPRHGPNRRHIPAGYVPPGSGVNYRHVRAPADGGRIPALLYPAGWDIDLYPEVFVRYRIDRGVPLSLSLKPFGRAALLVALSPTGRSDLAQVAEHVLHDDGQWHELLIDVREVRKHYPDIQFLEGIHFLGSPHSAVKEGQWYDLDTVIIRPIAR